MGRFFVLLAMALTLGTPAYAKWHRASTDHFVIYADEDEKELRAFARRLESYHSAMTVQMGREEHKPSPSNRVTVYVVRSGKDVQKLMGEGADRYLQGFYMPRAGGSVAFIPRVDTGGAEASESEQILYHEYAHHFLHASSSVALPRWLSEGFAEFYSTSKFNKDGSVGLGLPANHRAGELGYAVDVPASLLLDTAAYLKKKTKAYDEFYGKSWALFHYLTFDKDRSGQLKKYLSLVLKEGVKEIDAATTAFGDLKVLDRDLERYLKQSRLHYVNIAAAGLQVGNIDIKPLDPGEAAMMPLTIQSKRGVTEEQAKTLLPQVQAVAARFPQNAAVLSALAEAEFDAGNDQSAIDAADKAVAIDPANVNALIQKGYAMARIAENDTTDEKRWTKVRAQFVKVNKVENDHPIPLIYFFRSYVENGDDPPKIAIDGLEWALQLAPFDAGLRMNVAQQQLQDKRYDVAIETLKPLAFSPHDDNLTGAALKLIDVAKAGMAGEPVDAGAEEQPTG